MICQEGMIETKGNDLHIVEFSLKRPVVNN